MNTNEKLWESRVDEAISKSQSLWGKEFHMRLAQEECAEFIAAVLDKVAEEVADALLALAAARRICGELRVDIILVQKLERLEKRIAEDSEKHDQKLQGLK